MKRLFAAALLALSSTVFAATLNPVQLLNPAGSTAGQAIVSTGASTAPAWGTVTAGSLLPQAANTVVANATGSSASPTAVSVPNCVGTSSAVTYTAGSGFGCNASINALTLGGASFAAPGPIGSVSTSTGAFSSISAPSATIGGGTIDNTAIGATAASTGKFTTLSASSTVSGTGFSTYLASPPAIGGTAAASGKFTTLQATSTITPSSTAGIVGTGTNDNANAGSEGEYPTPGTTTATSISSGISANATSITLTAGDWDVQGTVTFVPGGSTVLGNAAAGISTTSATLPAGNTGGFVQISATAATGVGQILATPTVRVSIASSTPVFLIANGNFPSGTCTVNGFIRARRVR